MKTTLNKIKMHHPCKEGWQKLLNYLGKTKPDDEPLDLLTILNSNGFRDTLWCLKTVKGYDKELRLYAVWCVRQIEHLLTDYRSVQAINVAERYAHGQASSVELKAAYAYAYAAAADAAHAAADDDAAYAYAAAAADAAYAAYTTATDAAYDAYDAAQDPEQKLRELLETTP